jgi:hypothetical protein
MKAIISIGSLLTLFALASAVSAQVVISEIHYHPVEEPAFNADGTPFLTLTNDVHEFVEIQNAGASTVDLSGWTLAGGISYTFPTNTTIASGAFRDAPGDSVFAHRHQCAWALQRSPGQQQRHAPLAGYLGQYD